MQAGSECRTQSAKNCHLQRNLEGYNHADATIMHILLHFGDLNFTYFGHFGSTGVPRSFSSSSVCVCVYTPILTLPYIYTLRLHDTAAICWGIMEAFCGI